MKKIKFKKCGPMTTLVAPFTLPSRQRRHPATYRRPQILQKSETVQKIFGKVGHCGKKINKGHLKKIKIITPRFKLDLL
jgi:hypothetical protein